MVASGGLLLAGDTVQSGLEFQRHLLSTEPTRMFTAHLVHIDFSHWLGNALALIMLVAIFRHQLSALRLLSLYLLFAAAVSTLLLLLQPDVDWYRGLSGILHGVAAWGCCMAWRKARWLMSGALLALTFKLVAEQTVGLQVTSFAVVHAAHLYGAGAGALLGTAMTAWSTFSKSNAQSAAPD